MQCERPSLEVVVQRLQAFTASTRSGTVPSRPTPSSRPASPPLSPHTRPSSPSFLSSAKRAAVLVGLFPHPSTGEVNVLLTLRSSLLNSHSGEVALPGGKADEADGGDDVTTALREAEEEVGLRRTDVRVLGRINRVLSKNGLLVTPVVGVVPVPDFIDAAHRARSVHSPPAGDAQPPSASVAPPSSAPTFAPFLNAAEVSVLFAVPLCTFLSAENYRHEDRAYQSYSYRLHYFTRSTRDWVEIDASAPVDDRQPQAVGTGEERTMLVWGMTAHVLIAAARIAYDRVPDFSQLPYTKLTAPSSSSVSSASPHTDTDPAAAEAGRRNMSAGTAGLTGQSPSNL